MNKFARLLTEFHCNSWSSAKPRRELVEYHDTLIAALRMAQPALKDIVNGVSPGTDDEVLAAMLEEADYALSTVDEALKGAE